MLVNAEQVHEPKPVCRLCQRGKRHGHRGVGLWKNQAGARLPPVSVSRDAQAPRGLGAHSLRHTVALTDPDIKLLAQVLRVVAMLSPYSLNMNVALAKARGELSHTSRRDGAWD